MNSVVAKTFLGMAAVLGLTAAAHATASVALIGDTGTWRVTTYNPATQTGSVVLTNPYGVPPFPAITPLSGGNGWSIIFTPTADFMTSSSNGTGANGKTTQMDGKLDFYFIITDAPPVQLTTNVYEDGIWSTSGNGTVDVNGGLVVTGGTGTSTSFSASEIHFNSFPNEVYNPSGGWSNFDQLGGFTGAYSIYKISIDNTLNAEALSGQVPGSAYIAKKDFTLILTTDGSNGGGQPLPEPASLGVLAMGGLALLARRRRA